VSLWILILAAGLITYAIRLSFILILERVTIPDWFRRSLRYVPAAVLSAILVPELSSWNGKMDLSWNNPQIFAGLVASIVAWRTRNVVFTLLSGLACFLLLNAILS
jgi:branched-subunit amino acid transport protein